MGHSIEVELMQTERGKSEQVIQRSKIKAKQTITSTNFASMLNSNNNKTNNRIRKTILKPR